MIKQVHLIVRGRVQRVGFRNFTLKLAGQLEVTGWVRNRLDRSVEVMACGDEQQLKRFMEQLVIGPPGSNVENIETEWLPIESGHTHFKIRSTL